MKCHGEKYSSHQPQIGPWRHGKQTLVLTQANTFTHTTTMLIIINRYGGYDVTSIQKPTYQIRPPWIRPA